MGKVFIEESTLTAIGDAIRAKNGSSELIAPQDMDTAITSLETMPPEELVITGNCAYKFYSPSWNWYLNYDLSTKDITNCKNMFQYNDGLENIPFTINVTKDCFQFGFMCYGMNNITTAPTIISPTRTADVSNQLYPVFESMFQNCYDLVNIPNDYFSKIYGNDSDYLYEVKTMGQKGHRALFQHCDRLRKHPDLTVFERDLTAGTIGYGCLYDDLFGNCYSLDEITNLPVISPMTSNYMSRTAYMCNRLKRFTFQTEANGIPKTARIKNQVLDLSQYVGHGIYDTFKNCGFTDDTILLTLDTNEYNSKKNSNDFCATDPNYSRYNHTSAVETINSLPDTSAYGTNIIKFNGYSGTLTEGGAIEDLTETEIAVATAKGWTVSFA